MSYPKYEKVDEHTIRIIMEKADNVSITKLLNDLKQLEEKRDQINTVIENIKIILNNAKDLGIVPEDKDIKKGE